MLKARQVFRKEVHPNIKCLLCVKFLSLMSAYALSSELPSRSFPYHPPSWAKGILRTEPEHGRLHLANLPTPLYRISTENVGESSVLKTLKDLDISFYIKRDDCTSGAELGGNKIRKLEFLLADAINRGYDSVVTIGGEQSNHCRATASASRMIGLEPHLILRSKKADIDLGLVGNILIDRMVGSKIYTCTPGEYGRVGSRELVARLCKYLESQGKKPYPIPVGGSNGLGSWGYINGVDELVNQWSSLESKPSLDHIVFACGSGGTAAGIAIGVALAHGALNGKSKVAMPKVHAIGVCDNPAYFYDHVSDIADQMGIHLPSDTCTDDFVREHMTVIQGKGLGYALATDEELDFLRQFAEATGIVLDPVYSGKALYNFFKIVEADPEQYRGKNVMFWHTGGALGLYDKSDDLFAAMQSSAPCQRLDVYGKGIGIDVSKPSDQ